ncbi:flagellar hook-associated protein FlgK [Pseudoroseicyclus tamaricis]|uniref:Flagellar hook-associated protein 1 n=1 Tax=Pseudoroseicyclus tamaricis TaxID=2705421 RepID=A0A6B2K3X6_9RHOB|nr:flagellar hook-associated protein FlgK [Pseudoroseicyclus tamaricis]NDV02522.1 flagellar hook-associated protein FlgK [Pseudoroseicyclus tamaricis]
MSFSHALNNALSGLTATSRMAEVTSDNISNAMTDGFGRREIQLSSTSLGGQGGGVRVTGVERMVDRGILSDRRAAGSAMAYQQTIADAFRMLEFETGSIDDPHSIGQRMASFEAALTASAADPSSEQRLANVFSSMTAVAGAIKQDADAIQVQRAEADALIASHVDTLNTSLEQVYELNNSIQQMINSGGDPNALVDERQRVIDRISEIVPVREIDRQQGKVALVTQSGEVLLDGRPAQYEFQPRAIVTADMTLASGGLDPVMKNGQPMGDDGVGKLSGGALEAAFKLRDDALPAAADALDEIAADLIGRFEDPSFDPTRAPGTPGLFTDGGAELGTGDITGLASRIAVNDAVDPAEGGALWRLRAGVGAAGPVNAGDASQLSLYADALADKRALPATGGAVASAATHAGGWVADVSTGRVNAEEALGFAHARYDTMKAAEYEGGVDTDYEMQQLLIIEQAYAANARVVQTIDQMMRQLLEI